MDEEYGQKVRELLPSKFERIDEVIRKKICSDDKVEQPSIPGFVWELVGSKATEAVHDLMDCDAFELLAHAWSTARELHECTDESKHPPGKESLVFLGEHKLSTNVHPILELTIGSFVRERLRFTLELVAKFDVADLVIFNKHIVAIDKGVCSASAQLKYGNEKLHNELKSKRLTLAKPIKLRAPGLAIL